MRAAFSVGVILFAASLGCGQDLYVGSDVVWAALHEDGTFDEWTAMMGGGFNAMPPSPANSIMVSSERPHHGMFSAKLSIATTADMVPATTSLARRTGLPPEAYFSAWYYLPQSVNVGVYWVIMKFRTRQIADDPTTAGELYDLNLKTLPNGTMSLRLYDHRMGIGDVPQKVDPVVPVGKWFQIEVYYNNAQDAMGHLTLWLDGNQVLDVNGKAMGPSPWVGWEASSIGVNLTPNAAVLFVDDAAVSLTRVGPNGVIAR